MRHAVIMAGGGGTRLWPASRRLRPKQLLPLGARPGESLLGATVRRLAPLLPPERVWIVTAADQAQAVAEAVPQVPAANVVAEPAARNTAAALGLAALHVRARDPEAILAALPADHHIGDEDAYRAVLERAWGAAARGARTVVTIGLRPTRPETGYGYLELGDEVSPGVARVARFVEKPDRPTAERYLASGRYLWNGGMFFFGADALLGELGAYMPETARALDAIGDALRAGGEAAAARAAATLYPPLPSISIDFGVMEKAADVLTVPGDFGWSDVGSWAALADTRDPDADGNVVASELSVLLGAKGNVVVSDPGVLVALIGVEGLVVVQAGDAVLVAPRERAQDVRDVVRQLERRTLGRYT